MEITSACVIINRAIGLQPLTWEIVSAKFKRKRLWH